MVLTVVFFYIVKYIFESSGVTQQNTTGICIWKKNYFA